uniref:DUF1758 domain-containing protein n=1 Tax=Gongylonema pulchrum TaxID=637853 RepID=A0A183DVP4_9BILA
LNALLPGQHWNGNCEKHATYEERRRQIRSLQLCFKCLKRGRAFKACAKSPICFHCKRHHNRALCAEKFGSRRSSATNLSDRNRRTDPNQATLLLLCKSVWVTNPERPTKKIKTTVFFNSGCQQPFITNKLANQLGLTSISITSRCISIVVFAQRQSKNYEPQKLKVGIALRKGNVRITPVNTMDFLTQEILTASINNSEIRQI